MSATAGRRTVLNTLVLTLLAFAAITNAQSSTTLSKPTSVFGVNGQTTTTASRPTSITSTTTTTESLSRSTSTSTSTTSSIGVPPLIVPDTSGAPFMQKSDLPEGFVFICVGATLGFFALSILLWRGLVAWSLHLSVKRAAADRYMSEKKALFGGPSDYRGGYHSATPSYEQLSSRDNVYQGGNGRRQTSSRPSKKSSRQPATNSLFYSPTAGIAQGSAKRTSNYLPAGYYASGASTLSSSSGGTSEEGPDRGFDTPPPPPKHDRSLNKDLKRSRDVPRRERRQSGFRGG